MKNIAIITARSGSKGLIDKNIKLLNGKPLIWYAIRAAIESNYFSEIMVSTDSEIYAEIAKQCGATVPFIRSKDTSDDNASTWDVVREVLTQYKKNGKKFDNVMILQPTSPLRTSEDIKSAFEIMIKNKAKSVVAMCEMEHSPLWSNTLPDDKNLKNFIRPEVNIKLGRQYLKTYYRINGAIYLAEIDYSDLAFDLYNENSYAYVMPKERSVDIDTQFDFCIAELLLASHKN